MYVYVQKLAVKETKETGSLNLSCGLFTLVMQKKTKTHE